MVISTTEPQRSGQYKGNSVPNQYCVAAIPIPANLHHNLYNCQHVFHSFSMYLHVHFSVELDPYLRTDFNISVIRYHHKHVNKKYVVVYNSEKNNVGFTFFPRLRIRKRAFVSFWKPYVTCFCFLIEMYLGISVFVRLQPCSFKCHKRSCCLSTPCVWERFTPTLIYNALVWPCSGMSPLLWICIDLRRFKRESRVANAERDPTGEREAAVEVVTDTRWWRDVERPWFGNTVTASRVVGRAPPPPPPPIYKHR